MKNNNYIKLGVAFVLIIFGVTLMIWPTVLYGVITYVLGGALIISGLLSIHEFFISSAWTSPRYYPLIGGVALIISGLALLIIPVAWIQLGLGLIVAIGLLVIGLATIGRGLLERGITDSWIIRLLIGVIMLLGSLLVFSRLNETSDMLAFILGGVTIYVGFSQLLGTILIRPNAKTDPNHIDIDLTKK